MKTIVLCFALLPVSLVAQRGRPMPSVPAPHLPAAGFTPGAGALGGRFLSPVSSRPLGGITPPRTPVVRLPNRTGRYIGPVFYWPNAFDSSTYSPDPYAVPAPQASPAPVIVNQYFGSTGSEYARSEFGTASRPVDTPPVPGDPIGETQNYYLIAYKDHSVYSALAYWLESGTLHYVTTQNTHNQASLSLIDVDETTKLNADRSVPFSLSR